MKKGDFVVVGWCGCGTYLAQVERITPDALEVSGYVSFDKSTNQPSAGSKVMGPYPFVWGSVDYVNATSCKFAPSVPDVRIRLNDEYTAVVHGDKQSVTVGCQKLSRDVVLRVANALK